jgi:DNA repair protein RecN (Recombination protein N)
MLALLRIRNLALIPELELELEPGFNVFTGETGAGKSLLIGAIGLLRGERSFNGKSGAEVIRAGEAEASVEAIVMVGDREVLARRVLARSGRSRCYLDGALVTAEELRREVGARIDLTSQHESQALLDPAAHLAALDEFAELEPCLVEMRAAYEALRAAAEEIAAIRARAGKRDDRVEFLRFQRDEIDGVKPEPGEDEALVRERDRRRAAGALRAAAAAAAEALDGRERSIRDELAEHVRQLAQLAAADAALDTHVQALTDAQVLCEEAARSLQRYAEGIDLDPARLEEVEDRLHAITKLCRKHGGSVASTLARRDELDAELTGIERADEDLEAAQAAARKAKGASVALAGRLSEARGRAAGTLARQVEEALRDLAMEAARLEVQVGPRLAARAGEGEDDWFVHEGRLLGPAGWDRAELLIATNRGEAARPIGKIASGGELSRVTLALRQALIIPDVLSYVFDEVDAGIGGGTAELVGRRLATLAARRQVLCVTHLPQIAAFGRAHYRVEKHEEGGRTATRIERLSAAERREEIARMLGGLKVTAKTRAHAAEMLERAG